MAGGAIGGVTAGGTTGGVMAGGASGTAGAAGTAGVTVGGMISGEGAGTAGVGTGCAGGSGWRVGGAPGPAGMGGAVCAMSRVVAASVSAGIKIRDGVVFISSSTRFGFQFLLVFAICRGATRLILFFLFAPGSAG